MIKIQFYEGIQNDEIRHLLLLCTSVVLSLASSAVVLVVYSIFIIYRSMIDIILRITVGKKYGGLMSIADMLFCTNDVSKIHITSVLVIRSDKERDILTGYKQLIQKKVFDKPDHYPKIVGTMGKFSGYRYLIKNTCKIDECVVPLPIPQNVTFDEQYLKELTSELINKPLPQNNTAMWECLMSQVPLQRNENDPYYYYPYIVRIHHAVADGTSSMAFLLTFLGDDNTEIYSEKLFEKLFKTNKEKKSQFDHLKLFLKKIKEAVKSIIYIGLVALGRILLKNQFKREDENALHGPALCGDKIVAWTCEDNVEFVPIVKKIKNRIDTKFSHVIMTSISACLSNFFKRNSLPVPERISTALPILLAFPKLDKSKPVPLENKTAYAFLELPSHQSDSLIETLRKVTKKIEEVRFEEVLLNRFIVKHLEVMPVCLIKQSSGLEAQTCLITNVPGGSQVKLLGGCILDRVVPFAPNMNKVGVTVSILTYDDKFQISLLIDKALLQSQKEAQKIVDDIFYYIKLLEVESRNVCGEE